MHCCLADVSALHGLLEFRGLGFRRRPQQNLKSTSDPEKNPKSKCSSPKAPEHLKPASNRRYYSEAGVCLGSIVCVLEATGFKFEESHRSRK